MAAEKSEFAVALDEALTYGYETNGQTRIRFLLRGEIIPDDRVFDEGKIFKESFVLVGTVLLLRVPARFKINAEYYVNYVLKSLFSVHLPRLHPEKIYKLFLHHESIKPFCQLDHKLFGKDEKGWVFHITAKRTPIKTQDVSPLDFFGFGYLKKRLLKKKRPNI